MLPQQYCLRWRYHHSNLQTMFSQLLEREAFCDVTIACEGKTLKAHKIVLSACSTYFDTILSQYEEKDPILIMKDVKYVDIKSLVEFMYKGEINVDHCHLATLLKTAEELRIKGLAEVSWRDDDNSNDASMNGGVQSALPHVSTVMDSPKNEPPNKRKRGRPPIDDYDPNYSSKTSNAEEGYSNDAMSNSDQDLTIWEDDNGGNDMEADDDNCTKLKYEPDDDVGMDEDTRMHGKMNTSKMNSSSASSLTAAIEKEWPDVIKMNDYLSTGRRQQFWEEPFTKRVMDAIKTKNLEMKIAAELLGVSYGTLYGRYRDAYGCLKHPYRSGVPGMFSTESPTTTYSKSLVRDFWSEQGPTDILMKLKRKELTLFRAAEQLNVTPQTLSNYLISMSQLDSETIGPQSGGGDAFEEGLESEEDTVTVGGAATATPMDDDTKPSVRKSPPNNAPTVNNASTLPINADANPLMKKEKLDSILSKVNNNSDHSNTQSNNSEPAENAN